MDKRREYMKEYCRKNRKRLNTYGREYYQREKVRIKVWMKKHMREKYRNNPKHRIAIRLRRRLRGALNNYSKTGKIRKSKDYNINYDKIINHLKPFPSNMSKYHIDHIKPLCSFDLNNPLEIKKAFAPENHQWLSAEDNIRKGGRLTSQETSNPSAYTLYGLQELPTP